MKINTRSEQISVEAKIENLGAVSDFVTSRLEEAGCPMFVCMNFAVAVDEIFSNIAYYAYPDKNTQSDKNVNTDEMANSDINANTYEKMNSDKKTDESHSFFNSEDPSAGMVTVIVSISSPEHCASITFIDSGTPFDPLTVDEPDLTLGAEEREIGGLGIFMVKKMMDDVSYQYIDGKNTFTIMKNF